MKIAYHFLKMATNRITSAHFSHVAFRRKIEFRFQLKLLSIFTRRLQINSMSLFFHFSHVVLTRHSDATENGVSHFELIIQNFHVLQTFVPLENNSFANLLVFACAKWSTEIHMNFFSANWLCRHSIIGFDSLASFRYFRPLFCISLLVAVSNFAKQKFLTSIGRQSGTENILQNWFFNSCRTMNSVLDEAPIGTCESEQQPKLHWICNVSIFGWMQNIQLNFMRSTHNDTSVSLLLTFRFRTRETHACMCVRVCKCRNCRHQKIQKSLEFWRKNANRDALIACVLRDRNKHLIRVFSIRKQVFVRRLRFTSYVRSLRCYHIFICGRCLDGKRRRKRRKETHSNEKLANERRELSFESILT